MTPTPGQRAVLFLTTTVEQAPGVIRSAMAQYPAVPWTIYARPYELARLRALAPTAEWRSDKPQGGRLAFFWELRQAHYDLAAVAWHGHRERNAMKLLALVSAPKVIACGRDGEWFEVGGPDSRWRQVAMHRLRSGRPLPAAVVRWLVRLYGSTVGPLVGAVMLNMRLAVWERRRSRAP